MKRILSCIMLSAFSLFALAQQKQEKMSFNAGGEFKIAQFTDMHLGDDLDKNEAVVEMIREMLDSESPDLVIFSGDNTTTDKVGERWGDIVNELSKRQIHWSAVLGNHDDEHALKRKEIIELISKLPYCVMSNIEKGISGEGNHIIPLYASTDGNKIEALLYCIDSNAYSTLPSVKGYGWITQSQINWYRNASWQYTQGNNGQPLPSLAFFHIPLPEYAQAWESLETKRYGEKNETECSPLLNSGMFLAMRECGDVMGTFAGHDHINDYIATFHSIALGYGRASGGTNTYGDKTPGCRIIVLKEGCREFDTWIREKGNTGKLYRCTYPDSFLKKK